MVANRLCEPDSKLGVWERWLAKVHMPSCTDLKLRHMYEAMDLLHENIEQIEKSVFFSTANLLNLEVDLIFYDTTTASLHVEGEDQVEDGANPALRKFGHSKGGLGTADRGGPGRHPPGDSGTQLGLYRQHRRCEHGGAGAGRPAGGNLGRALFVADSGMNSEDNRSELARACGKYLLACRMAAVTEIRREVLAKRGRYTRFRDNLHAKEVIVGDGQRRRRRYILCFNPKEAERQRHRRREIVALLEAELAGHKDSSTRAQWAIELLASKRFKRYLRVTRGGHLRIDQGAVCDAAKYDGKWVIETNDDTISLENAACGYKHLMVIERCFRSLKRTRIKLTPMYHWASRRIVSHVKICVLALLLERVAELDCGLSWHQIKTALDTLQVTEIFDLNRRGLMRNELTPEVESILKSLKIKAPKQIVQVAETA